MIVFFLVGWMVCATQPAPVHHAGLLAPGDLQWSPLSLEQIMELQRMQMNPFAFANQPQPLFVLLPKDDLKSNELDINDVKPKADNGAMDGDADSVVIDAPSLDPSVDAPRRPSGATPGALVVLPGGRLSLGDFISAIPWLPIEVNVPDTVSWAYNGIANGIASIISIIGQRFPFHRPSTDQQPTVQSLKYYLNNLQIRNSIAKPVLVVPLETRRLNIPIQV